MKQIVLINLFLLLTLNLSAQKSFDLDSVEIEIEFNKNVCFAVENGNIVTIIPSMTTEKQCQFIAYRSVNSPIVNGFDTIFFYESLQVMQKIDPGSDVEMLKVWRSMFSPDGVLVLKEQYIRFIKQTIDEYNLDIKELSVSNDGDIVQIGNVTIQVIKRSCKIGKRKITIKEGYYIILLDKVAT